MHFSISWPLHLSCVDFGQCALLCYFILMLATFGSNVISWTFFVKGNESTWSICNLRRSAAGYVLRLSCLLPASARQYFIYWIASCSTSKVPGWPVVDLLQKIFFELTLGSCSDCISKSRLVHITRLKQIRLKQYLKQTVNERVLANKHLFSIVQIRFSTHIFLQLGAGPFSGCVTKEFVSFGKVVQ